MWLLGISNLSSDNQLLKLMKLKHVVDALIIGASQNVIE